MHDLKNPTIADDLVLELIKEKRKERRWRNIRFFMTALIVIFVVLAFSANNPETEQVGSSGSKDYVALIRLDGMIAPGNDFSAEAVLPLLQEAFSDQRAKGVIIDINSGGGTPVQAAIIHDAILQLKKQYHKKVVVVGEDMMASGAYYVAVSGDKIYVNPNTLTGSIGVIMKGFGFNDLIKKMGIERRVYASGVSKDRLDPFLPQTKDDMDKIHEVINEVHDNFDQVVIAGRAGKLHADQNVLFSGDFWSGQSAQKLGLIDELGNLPDAMQKEFHVSRYKEYSPSERLFKGFLTQFGATLNKVLGEDDVGVMEKM